MKILFLPAYFTPEQVASPYLWENLLESFAKNDIKTVLFVPIPSRGVSETVRSEFKKKKYEQLFNGNVQIHRFSMFKSKKNAVLRTIRYTLINIVQFYKGLIVSEIDMIIVASTPPTQGFFAALLKRFKKVPFVYCLQDIFPDSLVATGLTKNGSFLWKIGRFIENFTYRNADKIIVISEDFKKNILAKGVPESKIEVIYNWVDENAVIPIQRNQNILFDRYGLDRSKFYLTYNGNIGLSQNMDLLLDVSIMFKEIPDVHFIILGGGVYKKEIEKRMKEEGLKNITMLPFQPYEEISFVFSMGDVGLVISKENVGQNSVPSKTWSIMSAARPVLASFDENSELHEIIENNQVGIFAKAGDKEALYNAIIKMYNNPELVKEMGQNGRKFILKNLTREIGTSKYVEVLKTVVK